MLYEGFPLFLGRASELLEHQVRPAVEDPIVRDQLDGVIVLLAELGRMLPRMPLAIAEGNQKLEEALDLARGDAGADESEELPANVYLRHRRLLDLVSEETQRLHGERSPESPALLVRVRELVIEATAFEEDLVGKAVDPRGSIQLRR